MNNGCIVHWVRSIDIGSVVDNGCIMHWVRYIYIGCVMNNGRVMHRVWNIYIGGVADKGCIVHWVRDIHINSVVNKGCIMHWIRNIYIGGIMDNGRIMHRIGNIYISCIMDSIMYNKCKYSLNYCVLRQYNLVRIIHNSIAPMMESSPIIWYSFKCRHEILTFRRHDNLCISKVDIIYGNRNGIWNIPTFNHISKKLPRGIIRRKTSAWNIHRNTVQICTNKRGWCLRSNNTSAIN